MTRIHSFRKQEWLISTKVRYRLSRIRTSKMIYLDFAATTPIHPEVLEIYTQVATNYYGNASSLHDEGSSAKQDY